MATIAQNLETISEGLDDIKENLGLSSTASLANVVTKSASVVEPTGTLQITSNDTYDVTNYASAEVNVSGGGGTVDWTEYFDKDIKGGSNFSGAFKTGLGKMLKKIPITITPTSTNLGYMFNNCTGLIEFPKVTMTGITDLTATFMSCSALTSVDANFDTSSVTIFNSTFSSCTALTTVPILDFSSATNLTNTFNGCNALTDTSVDNILQSCIGATSYTGTKKLSALGFSSTIFPASRIEALPHYQAFVNAGWSRV